MRHVGRSMPFAVWIAVWLWLPVSLEAGTCRFAWDASVAGSAPLVGYRLYQRWSRQVPYDWSLPTHEVLLEDLPIPEQPSVIIACEPRQYWVAKAFDLENRMSAQPSNEVRISKPRRRP